MSGYLGFQRQNPAVERLNASLFRPLGNILIQADDGSVSFDNGQRSRSRGDGKRRRSDGGLDKLCVKS
jgi:hypothetical protein